MSGEFGYLDEQVPGIRWDAKYATWDNFVGRPVDGYLANRVVGTSELFRALRRAREEAAALGLGLLLWDGYRPQRAVDHFLRWSQQPEDGRTKPRHYPALERLDMFRLGYVAARSGHSRGAAVDLTLYDLATGELRSMGGDHDLMDELSHHDAAGIPAEATRNRELLRTIMEDSGFVRYPAEWWHYTLRHEPHPERYFDFPIT